MPRPSECAWLVDMGYVVKCSRPTGLRLDYFRFANYLGKHHSKVHPFIFNAYDESFGVPQGLQRFYDRARDFGMTVRLHPMSGDIALGTHKQRRVDVDFACHMVWQASNPNIGTLVLTTGDQDMVPAVQMCREAFGTRVVLFGYGIGVSRALEEATSERYRFEDIHDVVAE